MGGLGLCPKQRGSGFQKTWNPSTAVSGLLWAHVAVGQNEWDPILGVVEFTTNFRFPILVVGLNRMFTGG